MRHEDIWRGIDLLAVRHGLTASGLAKLAGLDPTSFNKSKRFAPGDGKPRWPSTESLAKVFEALGVGFEDFAALISGRRGRSVPLIGLARAGEGGFFNEAGFPVGEGWDAVDFPGHEVGEGLYALEITGHSMEPLYRPGDRVVVAPGESVRVGDRVVVGTRSGEVMAKVLAHRSAKRVELHSVNPDFAMRSLPSEDIAWIARIVWASQ
jgi:phage repressor protein C with HTH and peptisase S24 domain